MSARVPARAVAAVACVALVFAAVGWLYVIRGTAALAVGPHVTGALPLQRLASQDKQPLLRFLLAWVPAGLAAGAVLAAMTRLSPGGRALTAGATTFVLLFLTGAASDAVTSSEPVGLHVAPQLGRSGLWLSTAIMAACAALVPSRADRGPAP
jgi:hypothetical protein